MDAFHAPTPHHPLQLNEIRIVTILPGAFDDPIICTLEHINLSNAKAESVAYEAVSYAWGDPTETRPITLENHIWYPITLNLFSALTYLRDRTNPLCLWIDSLCINQQDLAERSAQVALMRDIFASASRVSIWLGDYGGRPKKRLPLSLPLAEWQREPPVTRAERQRYDTVETRHAKGRHVMHEVLARPWFTRMWVVQEVAVKHFENDDEKVKFLVGHLSVPWFVMARAFGYTIYIREKADGMQTERLHRENGLCSITKAWRYKHLLTRSTEEQKYVGFAEQLAMLLSRFTYFGATDPRDRIYSLLGMLVGNEKMPESLAPDYSKTVAQIFHEYAAWMLREGTCIDVLCLTSGPQPGRPSWVPNFVGRRRIFYRNLDVTNPARILQDGKLLEIEALPISVVRAAGPRCNVFENTRKRAHPNATGEKKEQLFVSELRSYLLECEEVLKQTQLVATPAPSEVTLSHLLKKLHGWKRRRPQIPEQDATPHGTPRAQLCKYFDDSWGASLMDSHWTAPLPRKQLYDILVTDLAGSEPGPRDVAARPYATYIAEEFDGYSIFVLEDGEVDFCRSASTAPQAEDMLCFLRGSTKRYILRPAGEVGQWTLVGTACMDAKFAYDWYHQGAGKEQEMRTTWAAMWSESKGKGNVFTVCIC
ncbi:hypothetical protein N0V88_007319 [Collariella sp. IMI 366227]|nr:hypothetical protein N0V88_007319 [Collariella sp. IMI 366227]